MELISTVFNRKLTYPKKSPFLYLREKKKFWLFNQMWPSTRGLSTRPSLWTTVDPYTDNLLLIREFNHGLNEESSTRMWHVSSTSPGFRVVWTLKSGRHVEFSRKKVRVFTGPSPLFNTSVGMWSTNRSIVSFERYGFVVREMDQRSPYQVCSSRTWIKGVTVLNQSYRFSLRKTSLVY